MNFCRRHFFPLYPFVFCVCLRFGVIGLCRSCTTGRIFSAQWACTKLCRHVERKKLCTSIPISPYPTQKPAQFHAHTIIYKLSSGRTIPTILFYLIFQPSPTRHKYLLARLLQPPQTIPRRASSGVVPQLSDMTRSYFMRHPPNRTNHPHN